MRVSATVGVTLCRVCLLLIGLFAGNGLFNGPALGQGILVIETDHWHLPRPYPRPVPPPIDRSIPLLYRVKSLEIDAKIIQSVARVQLSQTFVNEGSQTVEARCIFPVPYDAAVNGLTFMVDGKEIEGKVLNADEARRIYQSYVRKSQDPALVQWIGSGLLQTSVFPIPPGAERTVSVNYTQALGKTNGLLEWHAPIKAAGYSSQPIEKLSIDVYLEEAEKLGNVYSPTHAIDVKRPSDRVATVSIKSHSDLLINDFRLVASTTESELAADFLAYRPDPSDSGYFLMLMHPSFERTVDPAPKDIVLVLDKSGSMRGKKMEQARQALLYVLDNLPKKDRIGIVVYDSQVLSFRDHLVEASDQGAMESARSFVQSLTATGSTNIDQGLDTALKLVAKSDRPTYVVHLSDGRPTVGERDERQIVAAAVKANNRRARIFNFGVGHDVNSKLMNRLSSECFGQTFFVSPEVDIEASVSGLYDRLGQTALSDVRWELIAKGDDSARLTSVYPTRIVDIFSGDQISVAGRFRGKGKGTLVVTGKLGAKEMRFEQVIDLDAASSRADKSFIATLWASRRAAGIIDEMDLEGKKEELVRELIELAKKYGILTEYTAFLAEEPMTARTASANHSETIRRLEQLKQEAGADAFRMRATNQAQGLSDNLAASEMAQGQAFKSAKGLGSSVPGAPASGGMGGMGGMSGPGGLAPKSSPSMLGTNADRKKGSESSEAKIPLRRVGDRAFFQRGGQWIDSRVGDTVPAGAKKVERFSDVYFALLEKHINFLQPLLDLNEPIVVELDGVVYIL